MPRPLRVALCQLHSLSPEHEDSVEQNKANAEQLVSRAARQGADLAVLPEYVLTGIMADDLHLAADKGQHLDNIKAIAREHKIDIVAGSIVEKAGSGQDDALFNTAYYISKEGECLRTYRKRNLWHPEKEYLTPSQEPHQVFETSLFKAGICICWDLAWPEAFRALMHQGAEVIIVPTYWTVNDLGPIGTKHDPEGANEMLFIDSLIVSRAYENGCCIIFVNAGGPAKKGFIGRSQVAVPLKGVLAKMDDPEEELRIVEVDLDILKDAEEVYKTRADYCDKFPKGPAPLQLKMDT